MEICSGDVVQFGVDVIENSRRVTHGCIVATLKLYLPDGSEAIKAPSDESAMPFAPNDLNGSDSSHSIANLTTINLCQLAQCLREALNREEALQAKITLLQQILVSAQENAQSSWRSLVEEERLLSRIESLQMKLEAIINSTSKKPEDEMVVALRNDLMKLHDERELFEVTAKESIQRSGEQTLLTVAKIHELEVALSSANDEVNRHKEQSDELSAEIEDLADRFDTKATEFEEQAAKLKIAEDKVKELSDTLDKEREEYEEKISEWCNKVEQLESVTKLLEFKNESQHVQLDDLQAEVERLTVLRNSEQQEVEVDHSNNGDVQTTADQILNVQNELATSNANLTNEVEILNLNNRSKEKLIMTSTNDTECCNQHQNLISQIEELKSELHRMTVVSDMDTKFEDEEDAADKSDDESGLALMEQLLKSQREVASSNSKISDLTQKVERLEQQFKERSPENGHGDETGGDTSVGDEEDSVLDKQFRINASLRNEVADLHTQVSQLQHEKSKSSSTVSSTVCDDSKLEVLHLKEQLHVSQHELIACKLKMSECTQKMDRLKQDVIVSRIKEPLMICLKLSYWVMGNLKCVSHSIAIVFILSFQILNDLS